MKKSSKRKYAPKIIQHLVVSFSTIIISILLVLITIEIVKKSKFDEFDFYILINDNSIKTIIIFILANYCILVYCVVIIILLQKKTQDGGMFVLLEIIFALLLVTALFAFVFSILALKHNELVYE